jgi:diguanylate cyclase (GGDEF)-like protein
MTHEPGRGEADSSSGPLRGDGSGGEADGRWQVEEQGESADADQTASDTDQTASDTDQTASDADQAQSESDQRAAARDQAAADRDLARHPEDRNHLADYRRSTAERSFGERERQTGTLIRLRTAVARDEQAAQRDATAARRDMSATARDRLASSLELEAEKAANSLGKTSDKTLRHALSMAATARQNAAADRERAARDRARAAADREKAARDRNEATLEIQAGQLDELTGVYRRGMGQAILNHELLRAERSGSSLIVAFVDVDQLKAVNDDEGYAAGDQLLRDVADALMSILRPYDPVMRIGGDEFVCALSGVDLEEARRRLGQINESLAPATISFGITAARSGDTVASIIERSSVQMRQTRAVPRRFPPS